MKANKELTCLCGEEPTVYQGPSAPGLRDLVTHVECKKCGLHQQFGPTENYLYGWSVYIQAMNLGIENKDE